MTRRMKGKVATRPLDPTHTKTRIVDPAGGTGIDTDIQAAIDNLGGNGGVVYVEQGTYTITSPISIPSYVSLIGRGNVTIQIDSNSNVSALKNSNPTDGNDRIAVLGFHIKSRNTGQQDYALLDFAKVRHSLFEDLMIDGQQLKRAGISLGKESQGNRVMNCTVTYCDTGIALMPAGAALGPSKNFIEACRVCQCHVGIYLWRSHHNVVRGNVCQNIVATGSNIVGHDGILAEESCHNVFQGNVCEYACEHGIYVSGTTSGESWDNALTGNVCYYNSRCGIHLCGNSKHGVQKNAAVGNTCCSNQDGIVLDNYAKRNTLTGNACTNNSRYGIWEVLTGTQKNIILGNICTNNTSKGIKKGNAKSGTLINHNQE